MASEQIGLTAAQKRFYEENGYLVLESVFAAGECERFVEHLEDLHTGRKQLDGFFQQNKYGSRTFNQHLYDPYVLDLFIDPRLHKPLADCFEDEPEGVQTMHFYEGSEHPFHQDQYYLPDCMSAWIAMVKVDENNGPLVVQPGSHRRRLITQDDVPMTLLPGETYELQQHNRYFPAVEQLFRDNGVDAVQVMVNPGDVILFDGKLIHGGAKILKPSTRRHALACHYIPYHSENWERDWPRIAFDGSRRVHYTPG